MGDEEMIATWIEQDPLRRPVADARLREHGIAVWAIVADPKSGRDPEQIAKDYEIKLEAVCAAIAYYDRHRAEIDARVARNAA
jgi:uncharacterized protein (DUF433 family)